MSRPRLVALLLALATLLVYLPVTRDRFLDYDDDDYVTNNPQVEHGITWSGVKWAFTTGHASNWHPVTWLSHMLDVTLFGLNPGAHHFVNALFHSANAALLFILLRRLTGLMWPSAVVAALFAWHPLHVESVAWISERKDVLSTLLALLTLFSYTGYVKENRRAAFWLALGFFALGLMAKPMLVTLPFLLLLLDWWPLRRFRAPEPQLADLARLVTEKAPFFLLTVVSCIVTFFVQRHGHSVATLSQIPLLNRVENAPVAVVAYLEKMFWPANLAIVYPLKAHSTGFAILCLTILFIISLAAWLTRNRQPCGWFGWLWFLGTLVPVIGLVQVGSAAMADRYTYIPSIGIFIAIVFGLSLLAEHFQLPKFILPAATAVALGGCLVLTERQLQYWRDSETLFRHALAVTQDNDVAHVDLGVALVEQGRLEEALAEYRKAVQINPDRYQVHNNIGNMLDRLGRHAEALAEYREAIRLNPNVASFHSAAGGELVELGRFDDALKEFSEAEQLDPHYGWPHIETAKVFFKQGRGAEAVNQLRAAVRCEPDNYQVLAAAAHYLAANEDAGARDAGAALTLALKANVISDNGQPMVFDILGMAFAADGNFSNAVTCAQNALALANAAKMKDLDPIRRRLELYQNHQPWRESFLATNTPPAPAKN